PPTPEFISLVRADEVTHLREDLLAPASAIEDAVVPDARLQVMSLTACGDPRTELERGPRLAGGADVVVLARDAKKRRLGDRGGLDLAAARHEAAGREGMLVEDSPHGLQVEVGGQVHHTQVLVVERLGRPRALAVSAHEVAEQVCVGGDMPIE